MNLQYIIQHLLMAEMDQVEDELNGQHDMIWEDPTEPQFCLWIQEEANRKAEERAERQ